MHTKFWLKNLMGRDQAEDLSQACPTFFVVWTTLAKFGLYTGNMKFNT
jgi:hypothetical protein